MWNVESFSALQIRCFSPVAPHHAPMRCVLILGCILVMARGLLVSAGTTLSTREEVQNARLDLWGEAAMRQPNGASYEFFEPLLPPPRYVNADFHFYPIVLSAPNARVKGRLISNGSGVNLRGGARSWHDIGTPVTFRVGPDELRFGEVKSRLQHPTLAEGYLPIPEIRYAHAAEVYSLEAFASTQPELVSYGVIFVKFFLVSGTNNWITAQIDSSSPLRYSEGRVLNEQGNTLAWFDKTWKWERGAAHAKIGGKTVATMAIATKPASTSRNLITPNEKQESDSTMTYEEQRRRCVETWRSILASGINIETPEPLVNNAWRNLLIQDFTICKGDNLNYSDGNQYEKMYAAETSDAAVPLMAYGYENDMRRFLPVILGLRDKRLTNHFAGHKLDTLCRFYGQTRDVAFVKQLRSKWQKELDWILDNRGEHGLLPKDNYCTDIEQPVYSLSSNAKCWAALRDMIPVLEAIGDVAASRRVAAAAPLYKMAILAAADKSIRKETDPPFVPCALFGAENLHDPITETRIGSYWDLVANYIIGSRIFSGTEKETWVPRYFEIHGGLCMGLTRSAATNHTFWIGKHRTNPLYGMRYVEDVLRRDDTERAVVSFYGMLAHGMTRNTFIGAEGTAMQPLDEGGRQFYCPPNTASNGQWLWTLRHLLVQDFDMDNDGTPETLRLAFATPRRWLEDGKQIRVEHAPTAFGPVAFRMESHLSQGEVVAQVDLPARNRPKQTLIRARLPDGWKVTAARAGERQLVPDATGAVDLSGLTGQVTIRFQAVGK